MYCILMLIMLLSIRLKTSMCGCARCPSFFVHSLLFERVLTSAKAFIGEPFDGLLNSNVANKTLTKLKL